MDVACVYMCGRKSVGGGVNYIVVWNLGTPGATFVR